MGCYIFEYVRYLQFSGSQYNLDYGVNGYHYIHWKLNQFLHEILENGSPSAGVFHAHKSLKLTSVT